MLETRVDEGELGEVALTLLLSLSTVFSMAVERRLTRL